ncbi:carboxymuconolactone decarboxylase family protein [Streptomyces sp. NPDC048281]|uniref:carboxymuconolactone decarboxylase family protein n=1 Tax=Streptomyces sp. NPDC048281 TaxID=3154715 RepID=UPI003424F2F7
MTENDRTDSSRFEEGLRIRKEVLGAEFVERNLAAAGDFTRPVQEWVTEACWGTVWNRPGLDRATRSLINIAMLTALGKMNELAGHVRGALTNGCTVEQIQEVLLQTGVYCGAPAALEAFRTADKVIAETTAQD